MANHLFKYVPVDLYACYEPCFEPAAEQLAEWNGEPEPTLENTLFYGTDADGTQFFTTESFASKSLRILRMTVSKWTSW